MRHRQVSIEGVLDFDDNDQPPPQPAVVAADAGHARWHKTEPHAPAATTRQPLPVPRPPRIGRDRSPHPSPPGSSSSSPTSSPRGTAEAESSPRPRPLARVATLAEIAAPLTPRFSRELLNDPLRAQHFRAFLESEHSDENLTFYVAVEAYHSLDEPRERRAKAREIWDNLVSPDAPHQVNLPGGVVAQLRARLAEAPPDLFAEAQELVLQVLRTDKFHSFVASMFFDTMVKALQLRSIVINPQLFDAFLDKCVSSDPAVWEHTVTREAIEVYTYLPYADSTEALMVKTRCTIYRPAEQVLEVVSSPLHKPRYDPDLAACEVLREYDASFKVVRYVLRRCVPGAGLTVCVLTPRAALPSSPATGTPCAASSRGVRPTARVFASRAPSSTPRRCATCTMCAPRWSAAAF